jgi:hypothetical protein
MIETICPLVSDSFWQTVSRPDPNNLYLHDNYVLYSIICYNVYVTCFTAVGMGNSSYRRNFDLDKKNEIHCHSWKDNLKMSKVWLRMVVKWRQYSPVKFANFVYICITRKITIYFLAESMVIFTARNTNIYKICELHRAIFSSFYNI